MTVATDPRKTGIAVPASQLDSSAVAVILPSSGTSNATGLITHTTALPVQPTGTVKVFLPTGVVTAGSQGTGAGLYDATYSSTTACQLTGTGIVTANAAYTQVTTEVAMATTTVPAPWGVNGGIEVRTVWSVNNSVNNKTPRWRLGGIGGTAFFGTALTTSATFSDARRVRNRNSASVQVGSANVGANAFGGSTGALVTGALDTTAAQDLVFTGQLAVATDYIILEARETWQLP